MCHIGCTEPRVLKAPLCCGRCQSTLPFLRRDITDTCLTCPLPHHGPHTSQDVAQHIPETAMTLGAPSLCSHFISVAVMKCPDTSNLEEKGAHRHSQFQVIVHHCGKSKAKKEINACTLTCWFAMLSSVSHSYIVQSPSPT